VTGGASGGAKRGANAPPPERFTMSSAREAVASSVEVARHSARISMSADDSVAAGEDVMTGPFASVASEKRTLLSFLSPVSPDAGDSIPSLVSRASLADETRAASTASAPALATPAKRSASRARRLSA
jgi:hypothetical protein